jgi:hypothetical protein
MVALVLAGCFSPVSDLVSSHVEPGGTLTAALGTAAPLSTKALADATGDPMTVNASSAFLVFGLVVGDDVSGMPGKTMLLANQAVTLTVTATSRAQLSVHINGTSCATTSAVVHLSPDGKGHLDGDFQGSGAGCTTTGTLKQIPIDH